MIVDFTALALFIKAAESKGINWNLEYDPHCYSPYKLEFPVRYVVITGTDLDRVSLHGIAALYN